MCSPLSEAPYCTYVPSYLKCPANLEFFKTPSWWHIWSLGDVAVPLINSCNCTEKSGTWNSSTRNTMRSSYEKRWWLDSWDNRTKTTNVVTSHKIWSWTSIPNCSFVRKHLKTYSSVSQQKVGWLPLTPRQSCFCFYKWSGPPVDKHVFSKTLLNTMR